MTTRGQERLNALRETLQELWVGEAPDDDPDALDLRDQFVDHHDQADRVAYGSPLPAPMRQATARAPSVALQRRRLPWRRITLEAGAVWLVTRVIFAVITYYGALFAGPSDLGSFAPILPAALLQTWGHGAARAYAAIALAGYVRPADAQILPLSPALTGALTFALGASRVLAAEMLIANLAALGACVAIAAWAYNDGVTGEGAWLALRLTLAFPFAFVLAGPTPTSLALALAVTATLAARRGAWRWAALWALLAGLTSALSLALIPLLLWEFARQHRQAPKTPLAPAGNRLAQVLAQARTLRLRSLGEALDLLLVALAVPVALGGYLLFLWARFGDPLVWAQPQPGGGSYAHSLRLALVAMIKAPARSYDQAQMLVNVGVVLFVAVVVALASRGALPDPLPIAYVGYVVALLALCFVTPIVGPYDALPLAGPTLMVAFPVFLALGRWSARRPWLATLLLSLGLMAQAALTLAYLANGTIG